MDIVINRTKYAYLDYENIKAYDTLLELANWTKTHSDTNKTTNCPNCGAPITSSKCEYCGTDFEQSAIWGMSK